jgi:hypothetical protein
VLLGLRLVAARVREVAREADLRVRLDQEARNVEARETCFDALPQALGAGRLAGGFNTRYDELAPFETNLPNTTGRGEQAVQVAQKALYFSSSLLETLFS